MRLFQSTDSNCRPLSVVIVVGTPNLAIHPLRNALSTTSADIAVVGMVSYEINVYGVEPSTWRCEG